jgi:hypothetical protein
MEQVIPFDEWIKTAVAPNEDEYCFVFDSEGVVTGLHPAYSVVNEPNKIQIDTELALSIYDGVESFRKYRVNPVTKELVKISSFSETQGLTKMDDVLHRIVDKQWSSITDPDITVSYNSKILSFSLNEKYKNTIWDGETEMIFLVTDYNDPNVLRHMLSFRIGDIVESTKSFELLLPKKFSVYTRRVFDKYIFETI